MKELYNPQSKEWNQEDKIIQDLASEFGGGDHIIKVYKSWVIGEKVYIAMPLAHGSLHDYLWGKPGLEEWAYVPSPGNPLSTNRIWQQFIELLDALYKFQSPSHENRRGYHSDLKPQNILIFDAAKEVTDSKGGRLVITDWGNAHIGTKSGTNETWTRQRSGTIAYLPPENESSDELALMNTRYDVWPMGCILIEILIYTTKGPEGIETLKKRREATTTDFYRQRIGGVWSVHAGVTGYLNELETGLQGRDLEIFTGVRKVIDKMLEIEPRNRSTCGKACKDLSDIFNNELLIVSIHP